MVVLSTYKFVFNNQHIHKWLSSAKSLPDVSTTIIKVLDYDAIPDLLETLCCRLVRNAIVAYSTHCGIHCALCIGSSFCNHDLLADEYTANAYLDSINAVHKRSKIYLSPSKIMSETLLMTF